MQELGLGLRLQGLGLQGVVRVSVSSGELK